jgi:carbohydrate-selective porin OprB
MRLSKIILTNVSRMALIGLIASQAFAMRPDVQYLWDPGLVEDSDDTLVPGLRALINL